MEKGEVVPEEKIPWLWIIPWIIIYSFGGVVLTSFISMPWPPVTGPVSGPSLFSPAPFMIIALFFITTQMLHIKIPRLNKHALTYIYISTLIASMYAGYYGFYWAYGAFFRVRIASTDFADKYVPLFWIPSKTVVEKALLPGPVPWADWMPSIINWIVFALSWPLLCFSMANIYRRQWLDVEELPFPYATAAHSLICATAEEKEPRTGRTTKMIIMISLVLGFLYPFGPYLIRALYPWFPDVYGFVTAPWGISWQAGSIEMFRFAPDLAKAVVGPFNITVNPFWICLAFLAPLKSILSVWVGYVLVLLLIPNILFNLFGYYTGIQTMAASSRLTLISQQPPLKLHAVLWTGMIPGIAVWWLILNWKYIASTLKLAIGKGTKELEKNEPLSYRKYYILLLLSLAMIVAQLGASGIEAVPIVIMLVFQFLRVTTMGLSHGLMGYHTMASNDEGIGFFKAYWPSITSAGMTQSYVMSVALTDRPLSVDDCLGVTVGPMGYSLGCYRLGGMVGINSMSVFKVMLVAMIIGPIVAAPTLVWVWHTFGAAALPKPPTTWNAVVSITSPSFYNARPAIEPWWHHALAGFLIVGALSYLHMHFLWFPIEPVGFTLGVSGISADTGMWFAFLIAWILKFTILKIGGSKAYENYGIPCCAGYVSGQAITVLLIAFASMFRYFVPA